MIWNAAIYCTPVVRDSLIVSLHCTMAYKPQRKRLYALVCHKDEGAHREDERTL
jgi:hypothetical protein